MVDRSLHPPRRIVVGVDGSEGARRALEWAIREARTHEAALDVISAWTLPADWAQGYNPELMADLETESQRVGTKTRAEVEEVVGTHDLPEWLTITTQEGPPAAILLERAEQADLIVVGSRGRGGFARMLLGSVSSAVVHHAPCPVVVIPARSGD